MSNAKAPELADHGRQLFFDGAGAMKDVDHRRVEPPRPQIRMGSLIAVARSLHSRIKDAGLDVAVSRGKTNWLPWMLHTWAPSRAPSPVTNRPTDCSGKQRRWDGTAWCR